MSREPLTGVVIDERYELTVTELSRACDGSSDWVLELVEEGVIEPVDPRADEWRFPGPTLTRARTARRLQRDLGVNLAGAALVLEMMEELETLRARLRRLEGD